MAQGRRPDTWGWTLLGRRLLSGLAVVLAAGLGILSGPDGSPAPGDPAVVVDANEAPPGVLDALPKLGPAMVARIVDERGRRPFRSMDDLDARVRGIGPATVAGLRPHLRFPDDAP